MYTPVTGTLCFWGKVMPAHLFRVGLIVPSSNTVMEPDFHRNLGSTVVISTTRIFLEQVTREAELRMLQEDLPRSVQLIKTVGPDVIVFGCTSASSLGGLSRDAEIAHSIEQETRAKVITVLGSVLAQLSMNRPQKVALFTPYQEELTRSVAECLAEGGYRVVKAAGMGILNNREIGEVTPGEIVNFVESHMAGVDTDCLFLSCTNWQAIGAIEPLQAKFGVRVISSNQAAIDAVRQMVAGTEAQTERGPLARS